MVNSPVACGFTVLPSQDLQADIAFYTRDIKLQLRSVYPADKPRYAELAGYGLSLLLDMEYQSAPGRLLIRTEESKDASLTSPSGTEVCYEQTFTVHKQTLKSYRSEICTLRGSSPWTTGRAGTHTRELIPSRLGGALSASHLRIPNGGPVADRVHYHTTEFQLVFCIRGWIKLVFEDQGEALTLMPGDCVTQPPHIRHKVLETSNGLEVIEISTPSEHVTAIDNELELPTTRIDSHRLFHGQRFCHFQQAKARWQAHRIPGFAAADMGIADASADAASACLLRAAGSVQSYTTSHSANVLFSTVLAGSVRINKQLLVAGDAFTLPPNEQYELGDISSDVAILEVSLPGAFQTTF